MCSKSFINVVAIDAVVDLKHLGHTAVNPVNGQVLPHQLSLTS